MNRFVCFADEDDVMLAEADDGRACRFCGCTQNRACVIEDVACHWVAWDVCSNPECVARAERARVS